MTEEVVALTPELRDEIQNALVQECRTGTAETKRLQHDLQRDLRPERARLHARAKKCSDGHLDGVIPADLYAAEQRASPSR